MERDIILSNNIAILYEVSGVSIIMVFLQIVCHFLK